MFVVTVEFKVHQDAADRFADLLRENADRSRTDEPGCHHFDVCRNASDPATFFLYEVYTSPQAFDAHSATPHFRHFDAAVTDMVAAKTVRTYDEVWQ